MFLLSSFRDQAIESIKFILLYVEKKKVLTYKCIHLILFPIKKLHLLGLKQQGKFESKITLRGIEFENCINNVQNLQILFSIIDFVQLKES